MIHQTWENVKTLKLINFDSSVILMHTCIFKYHLLSIFLAAVKISSQILFIFCVNSDDEDYNRRVNYVNGHLQHQIYIDFV